MANVSKTREQQQRDQRFFILKSTSPGGYSPFTGKKIKENRTRGGRKTENPLSGKNRGAEKRETAINFRWDNRCKMESQYAIPDGLQGKSSEEIVDPSTRVQIWKNRSENSSLPRLEGSQYP